MPKVEVKDWQGGSPGDLLSFLKRRSQLYNLQAGKINGGAYIIDCTGSEVPVLVKLNGIRFAGKALKIRAMDGDNFASTPQTSEIMSVLQGFLQSRYDPNTKLLNLMSVRQDPTLASQGFFNTESYASKVLQALVKVAEQPFGPVLSVSLESNSFQDISDVQGLSTAFPNLVNLSLANNHIATAAALNPWKKRFTHLKELVLNGNPVSENQIEMKKIIDFFPRLTTLNGVIVRTEKDLPKLAMPVQQNFFENPDIQSMAQGFIAEFFKCWDSDRQQLMPLYDNLSEFSFAWDGFAPHVKAHTGNLQTSKWLHQSRNLAKASSHNLERFLTEKIAIGQEAIGAYFHKLPKTRTDLTRTDNFAFEAWSIQNVRSTPDSAVVIAVHGMFNETGPRAQKYSFDRYLVVLPGPNGSMIIASDMMTIRQQGNANIFKSNQLSLDNSSGVAPGAAPPGTPAAMPSPGGGAPGPSITGPDAVVQQLMQQTRLNLQYATQCAQQANFDLQQALALFEQHRGQLPAEAFI